MAWMNVEESVFSRGQRLDWHSHEDAQLIYPSCGVMVLETANGLWIVPPFRACWLPAGELHRVEMPAGLRMHSVYCRGRILEQLPRRCGIVQVSNLLRELILALAARSQSSLDPAAERMAFVVADLIALQNVPLLFLPTFGAGMVRTVEEGLREAPGDNRSLAAWGAALGVSAKTLSRAFHREAHMTFSQFRTQMRLRLALERLAAGDQVTKVALDLGFASASSFIAAFRKATGKTPRTYFHP